MSVPDHAPTKFRLGTTVKWTLDPGDDYRPDDGWSLTYYFARSDAAVDVAAEDNGDGTFLVTIEDDDFSTAGHYSYAALAADGTSTHEIDTGQLDVLPSLTAAVDARSKVKIALDAVEDAINTKLTGDNATVASYSYKDRSLTEYTLEQLEAERSRLQAAYDRELRQEAAAKGRGHKGKIRARFI